MMQELWDYFWELYYEVWRELFGLLGDPIGCLYMIVFIPSLFIIFFWYNSIPSN